MKKAVGLILILFVVMNYGKAEIIVHQDKNGDLTISNQYPPTVGSYKSKVVRKQKRGGIAFASSVSLTKVPEKYVSKIKKLARKYNVDESLIIAVARAESAFNPFAVSKKGAVGIMQLMEGTARMYGVVNRYNADQNMEAGTRHLKYLQKKYKNNLSLVLAAYNAGEEAVKKYKGIPPYKETQNYIKKVMKYMGKGYSNYFATKPSMKIYQYRTKDGKIMITDTYPANAIGSVTTIE